MLKHRWLWWLLIPFFILEVAVSSCESVTRTCAGLAAIVRVWFFRDFSYWRWLKRDLADCDSILELGCGSLSPIVRIGYGQKTDTIEIFQPYVDKHCRAGDYRKCWQGDILKYDFPEKKYDAVVIFDVLEHLPRTEVERIDLFKLMERCARKKVIFFTPNGFIENDLVDEDPHQAHVSAWEPKDYQKRGYTVHGATGIRWILGKASRPKYHPYSLWEIVAMLSMPVIYDRPEWAWHSYAVKEIR